MTRPLARCAAVLALVTGNATIEADCALAAPPDNSRDRQPRGHGGGSGLFVARATR